MRVRFIEIRIKRKVKRKSNSVYETGEAGSVRTARFTISFHFPPVLLPNHESIRERGEGIVYHAYWSPHSSQLVVGQWSKANAFYVFVSLSLTCYSYH